MPCEGELHCVTIRPNLGRRTEPEHCIRKKISVGNLVPVETTEAEEVWNNEFKLANIPAHELYQRSCHGRLKHVSILVIGVMSG